MHAVLFGAGSYNTVYSYPSLVGRTPAEESALRVSIDMEPIGLEGLPHHIARHPFAQASMRHRFMRDTSPCQSSRVVTRLHPREVMLLPTGLLHSFQKCTDARITRASSPMLGLSGHSSYVGVTASSARSNMTAMVAASAASRALGRATVCFVDGAQ
jgi:hypothetical protein